MPTITTKDGTEIFYKDWGSGQLCVPKTLSKFMTCITPDVRRDLVYAASATGCL